jgi:hypothetical protein
MEPAVESWEVIHKRLMDEFRAAIQANVKRVEQPKNSRSGFNFELPEGFPEGSQEFFDNFAYALIRVRMENILQNLTDAVMTSIAKEIANQQFRQQ